ncbi:MAG: hypothetical protein AAGF97_10335 [Planctomycetota bacterium]
MKLRTTKSLPFGIGTCLAVVLLITCPPLPQAQAQNRHSLTSTQWHTVGSVGRARRGRGRGEGYFQPVRLRAPEGSLISVGSLAGFELDQPSPAQFGLQVTETYRFRISRIPTMEGVVLYPTLEMIDRLHPPAGRKQQFPVEVELTRRELREAADGAMITRVIYLDDPRNPAFDELRGGKQSYFEVFPGEDPLRVADELGRPMAILRLGAKAPPAYDVPASFVFDGPPVEETDLQGGWETACEIDPCLPCECDDAGDWWDEYLCDGGDGPYHTSVNRRGELLGLEPSETIGRFTTLSGETRTVESTRTCIYAPRFAVTKQTIYASQEARIAQVGSVQDPSIAEQAMQPERATPAIRHLELLQTEKSRISRSLQEQTRGLTVDNQDAAVANVAMELPHERSTGITPKILESRDLVATLEGTANAIAWSSAQAVQVILEGESALAATRNDQPQAVEVYEMPPGQPRLRILKLASTDAAEKGESVTFTLRFRNVGDTPLADVEILDNLLPRLVYEPGSQSCSLPATFEQMGGDAGSQILSWQLVESLEAGEGGEIQFRCRAE